MDCGGDRRWVGGAPVSRLQALDCLAKTALVVAAREKLINRVTQSIRINGGEFPVAALSVWGS